MRHPGMHQVRLGPFLPQLETVLCRTSYWLPNRVWTLVNGIKPGMDFGDKMAGSSFAWSRFHFI